MKFKSLTALFAAVFLMLSSAANASLINYDLVLTADADFTAFGGGLAGEQFFGTFSVDDSLLTGTYIAQDDGLTGSLLFMNIDIAGTLFSDVTTIINSNALRIIDGALVDISFLLVNANNDQLSVLTAFEGQSSWWALEGATDDNSLGGNTFGFSVAFSPVVQNDVPEPSSLALFALGLLALASRRFSKK